MKNKHSHAATMLGVMTSLCTAYAVIDWDAFDFRKISDIIKLLIITIPAINGYFSQIKQAK